MTEHEIEYVDANTSYCHTCERQVPNAHVFCHEEMVELEERTGEADKSEQEKSGTKECSAPGLVEIAFIQRPQATLYALGIVTFMIAFYLSNPLIGLAGAAILIGTTLYYVTFDYSDKQN